MAGVNYLRRRKYKRVKLAFTDFSKGINAFAGEDSLPLKYAVKAYNFSGASGALENSKGIAELALPSGLLQPLPCAIEKLYFYKRYDTLNRRSDDRLIAYAGGCMYSARIEGEGGFTLIGDCAFVKAPTAINYRLYGADVIIFCSEEDPMTVWDGVNPPYKVESAPNISTACVHYERLFATVGGEKSAVWFSDDIDPTNWDISLEEAGFIEITGEKGSLLKVIKFNDYVYIFRSYGISRLTAYAEQIDFSVITLFVSSGKIYPDTVTVCGDRIIFLAQDGIFSFDGYSAVKILTGVFPLLCGRDNAYAAGAFYNGCYYLACNAGSDGGGGEFVNNALIEYDISRDNANIIYGVDISSVAVISTENYGNMVFSLRGEHSGVAAALCAENSLFGTSLDKMWRTPCSDLGCPEKVKLLREIYLSADYGVTVDVISDTGKKTVSVSGGGGVKRAAVFLKGRRFSLVFKSSAPRARVSRPVIIADVLL